MKEKKVLPDWYIATTHWLTAGFVIPFVGMLVFRFILGKLPLSLYMALDINTLIALTVIVYALLIWGGVVYSTRFLDKTYVIKDPKRIALLSTMILLVLGVAYRIYQHGEAFLSMEILSTDVAYFLLIVVVFYFASNKYIKSNSLV